VFPGVRSIPVPQARSVVGRVLWEQLVLPVRARQEGVVLLHGLAFSLPLFWKEASVVTIFDLSFARVPQCHSAARRLYLRLLALLSARRASAVVAISQATKADVCALLGVPPGKVRVIYCGVEERFRPLPEGEKEAFRSGKGVGRYILFQGTLEPRKNLVRLLRAYALVRRQLRPCPRLVLAGAPGWGYREVLAERARLGLEADVLFTGFIPSRELPFWYAAAECFVFPSLYEGFGLPVLQAMASGTPVITSNASSLPEVAAGAAILVEPTAEEALAAAMVRLLQERELQQELVAKGLERARSFSWHKAAMQTAELYQDCLQSA
jgi:glycosyltransferase involved in cell wall biosynthesis